MLGPRSKTEERLTYGGVKQDMLNTTTGVGFGIARNSLQDDSDDDKIDEALRASFEEQEQERATEILRRSGNSPISNAGQLSPKSNFFSNRTKNTRKTNAV